MAGPELWWVTLEGSWPNAFLERMWQEVKELNYKMKEQARISSKPRRRKSFPCSLHSTPAAYVHTLHLEVLNGLETGRKHFGRGCPGWVS